MNNPDAYVEYYRRRKLEEAAAKARKAVSKRIPAASIADVMREQLEDLLDHVAAGLCGCSLCVRYLVAQGPLLEDVFGEPERAMSAKSLFYD